MKNLLKKSLSVILAITIIFSSAYVGLNEIDFCGLFEVKAGAASVDDLTFELNDDGVSYSVADCDTSASGELVIPTTYNGLPVTSIGRWAFEDCTSLISIEIPDSVTNIGSYAFYNCTSLASIIIPDNVTSVGQNAFDGTGYYNDSSNWENDVLYIGNHLIEADSSLSGKYTIKAGTKTIANKAFYNCIELISITIPHSVTSIGERAFQYCTNLVSITIPDGVTTIGHGAFKNCQKLTSIVIPDSVTNIGSYAFYNCTSLASITFPDNVTSIGSDAFDGTGYYNDSSNWENDVLYIGNHLIEAESSLSGKYTIKAGTKTIANDAFYNCTGLISITIPHSVTSIGERAFQYCTNLVSITIPDGVTTIGYGAFINCEKLTSIVIPDSVTYIGAFAFYLCKNLVSVKLSEQMTEIPDYLFYKSPSIKKIVIPLGVTSIGYCAFARCTGLETVEIPSSVTSLGACAFEGCTGLKEINVDPQNEKFSSIDGVFFNKKQDVLKIFPASHTKTEYKIPDTVTEIAYSSFCGASSLSKVSIPSSVKSIGGYAFTNCRSLKSVTIPESVTSVWYMAFGYHFDWLAYGEVNKAPDFTIYGIKGSAGETYANENEFEFIEVKKPAQPTLKKVYNENSYVKVTWRTVKGADLYRVYRMVSGGEYEYIGSTSNTYFNDKKAPAGKTCRYKIKAKNIAGYSDYSASSAVKHIDEPTLKSIENSAYGVLIKWDKVTGAEKYNVYRKVSGGEYKYIGATSKTYYTDKTAKSGTKYYYAIRAKRDDSVSSQSASLSKYYLADPTLNTPSSTTKGVGLRWSKVTGAEGYMIYRRTADGSYKRIATEKGVSNVTYRDTTAKKGTKYYYKVKAYKSKTYSAYSNTKTITDKY